MRLHLIYYKRKTSKDLIELKGGFTASQKDAGAMRKEIRQSNGYVPNSVETIPVDIPTTKNDLVTVLNLCLKEDFGSLEEYLIE